MGLPYPQWFNELVAKHKKEGLKAGEMLAVEPQIFKRFMDHSSKRVARDRTTKTIVFMTGLSAYTPVPINLFLRGESSIGKTYIVIEMLKYFPEEDVWKLGGLSTKAIVHMHGVLLDENGEAIDWSEKPNVTKPKKHAKENPQEFKARVAEWQKEREQWDDKLRKSHYIVDLTGKILVFLEAPAFETYQMLRPILSHDTPEISFMFTDKTSGGQLRTRHVIIKGWPATIFLSTKEEYIEDLATRSFTVTPDVNKEKIGDAIKLKAQHGMFPWKYELGTEFTLLQAYIGWFKNTLETLKIVDPLEGELAECYGRDLPRCMRDFNHLCALIKIVTAFHCMQRPVLITGAQRWLISTPKDLELILDVLPEIEETTVTGLPKHILDVFHQVIEPLTKEQGPFNYKQFTDTHNSIFLRKRSSSRLRHFVKILREIGYVDTEPDPSDKRKRLIRSIAARENLLDSVRKQFSQSFTETKLVAWLDEAKKSVRESPVFIKRNLITDEHSDIQTIYEEHYSEALSSLLKSDVSAQNILAEKQASLKQTNPDLCVFSKQAETHIILEKTVETLNGKEEAAGRIPLKPKDEAVKPLNDQAINKAFPPLGMAETLILLRSKWTRGTSKETQEQEFLDLIHEVRPDLTRKEAGTLFAKLIEDGEMGYDPEGFLVWC